MDFFKNFSVLRDYDNHSPQFSGISYRHRSSTPPLTVIDGQQAIGMIDQIAVTFQHTVFAVLLAHIYNVVRLLQNREIEFPR